MTRLLIIGCSATKRPGPGPMPAIDRYDGPIWRSLRARLAELPAAAAALEVGDLVVIVLSAEHGFIPAQLPIAPYDRRLDRQRAAWLSSNAMDAFARGRALVRREAYHAAEILVVGGELYRDCVARTIATQEIGAPDLGHCRELDAKTTWTRGGIGQHRAQLGAWLQARFAA